MKMVPFDPCKGSVWGLDDFSSCFRHHYLGIIYPLAVVCLSSTALLVSAAVTGLSTYRRRSISRGYQSISQADVDVAATPSGIGRTSNKNGTIALAAGRLTLLGTSPAGLDIVANVPRFQVLSIIVEAFAVVAMIVTNSATPSIAGLNTWIYVLGLVLIRLTLVKTSRSSRSLVFWWHTTIVYCLLWWPTAFIFRSAIIHPANRQATVVASVGFAVNSLLVFICLSSRIGNQTVLCEWEDGREPSHEQTASILSLMTYHWHDQNMWNGWKTPFDQSMVWNVLPWQSAFSVWATYNDSRGSTIGIRLIKHLSPFFALQWSLSSIQVPLSVGPVLLLRYFLQHLESTKPAPANILWLYLIGIPLLGFISCLNVEYAAWLGHKIWRRASAVLIGEIYSKALRCRATYISPDTVPQNEAKKPTGGAANLTDDSQASSGKIINIMSVDANKLAHFSAVAYEGPIAIFTIIVAAVMLWNLMGLSALFGLGIVVLCTPPSIYTAILYKRTVQALRHAADERIQLSNEVFQSIRIIKYFAWEDRFGALVNKRRSTELAILWYSFVLKVIEAVIWRNLPIIIIVSTFFCFTMIEKKALTPSIAFSAMALAQIMRPALDMSTDHIARAQEAYIAYCRIQRFVEQAETDKYNQLSGRDVDENGNRLLGFRNATFSWGGKEAVASDGSAAFCLVDLNIAFKLGGLNVISGRTGSGKTAMLMALLGELTLVSGRVYCPGGVSREEVKPDLCTGLANTIAYVGQSAWIMNANIRDNILFGAELDEERYQEVLAACALEHDLEILVDGDLSLVGEKGISLSGGQKQRISLARAFYSNSAHVLLDDCLSAVDAHTGHWIFTNGLCGPLMRGRTCILVTHNIQLCVPSADYVVLMENGRVAAQGSPEEIAADGILDFQALPSTDGAQSRMPSRVPSKNGVATDVVIIAAKKDRSRVGRDAMAESRSIGYVRWQVLKLWFQSVGGDWYWPVFGLLLVSSALALGMGNMWIRQWTNRYVRNEQIASSVSWPAILASNQPIEGSRLVVAQDSQTDGVNSLFYVGVMAALMVSSTIMGAVRDWWYFRGTVKASGRLHSRLFQAMTRARFYFFDITPLGQIMNRFSKDLQDTDQIVPLYGRKMLTYIIKAMVAMLLVCVVEPWFLVVATIIVIIFGFLAAFYLQTAGELNRLISLSRSPIYQHFGETLSGVTTIRAYGDHRRFMRTNLCRINVHMRTFLSYAVCHRWLAVRNDILNELLVIVGGTFILMRRDSIDPGAAGLILMYTMAMSETTIVCTRYYSSWSQSMNSVERLKEYMEVEQEAPAVVAGSEPGKDWPTDGAVEFVNFSTRYRKELDRVLTGVTVRIAAGEKVGVVGRTGAGKSSLALALCRALEADEGGRILIDGVDVAKIGLTALRNAVVMVPQDPTLFTGTIRSNLDPLQQYSDDAILAVLRQLQLVGDDEGEGEGEVQGGASDQLSGGVGDDDSPTTVTNCNRLANLDSVVAEFGGNLSQGQRQLLCLGRAMLRRPRLLVMDEATASIDYATDSKIQRAIRELPGTVITIAHRLHTVADYDKILVLDRGTVVEVGHPFELMADDAPVGVFRDMCEASDEMEALRRLARAAWETRKGV